MAYELFHNKAAKGGAPQLTIRAGRIALNAHAADILAKAGMRFAHILWDSDVCKLALKPTAKVDEKAFRLSIPAGKRGGTFSAQSFLNYILWNATKPVVVAAEWNERERLLEARLPRENIGAWDKGRVVKRKDRGNL
jgi:hypothetical protein